MDTVIRMNRRQILTGLASGTVVAFAPGCVENPTLGRSQLILVSEEQIAQLSAQAWQQSLQRERVSRDPALNAQLQRVGRRIAQASGLAYDWEFVVFDSDQENAWVLPGGKVAFYRGIMETMENDDQVATVMGHEAAHLAGRHAADCLPPAARRSTPRAICWDCLTGRRLVCVPAGSGWCPSTCCLASGAACSRAHPRPCLPTSFRALVQPRALPTRLCRTAFRALSVSLSSR